MGGSEIGQVRGQCYVVFGIEDVQRLYFHACKGKKKKRIGGLKDGKIVTA